MDFSQMMGLDWCEKWGLKSWNAELSWANKEGLFPLFFSLVSCISTSCFQLGESIL